MDVFHLSQEDLQAECLLEEGTHEEIHLTIDLRMQDLCCVLSNLLLAAPHPWNEGKTAEVCDEFVDRMIKEIDDLGWPATAEALRRQKTSK